MTGPPAKEEGRGDAGAKISSTSHPRRGAILAALLTLLLLLLLWWQATSWYEVQVSIDSFDRVTDPAPLLETVERDLRIYRRIGHDLDVVEAAIEVTLQGNVLSSILNRRFARLQGLVAFAESVPEDAPFGEQFRRFAASLYADSSGVRSYALAPGGEVQYIYPQAGNETVLGYRPLADPRPEIREDARRAMRAGEIVLSGPVELLQGGLGLIARAPVYRDGSFWGLANVVLELPALLVQAGLVDPAGTLSYALRDSRGEVFWGDPDLFAQEPVLNVIALPDGEWELAGVPTGGWEAREEPDLTLIRATGLALVLLLASVVYLAVNRQERLRLAVAERTEELAESNLRLEERVAARTQELERLYEEAETLAILRERQRLARELHDSVSQALYGIALGTRTARTLLDRGETEQAAEPLAYIDELAEGAVAEMRALIFELRPESLEREGLASVIQRQAEAIRTRHRLEVETKLCAEPDVSLRAKEALYRVTQEALNNVVKHAGASQVVVEMTCKPSFLAVSIRDDGAGFEPRQPYPGHLGLQTMRERVEQLGGTLTLNSTPGEGTVVEARLPLA